MLSQQLQLCLQTFDDLFQFHSQTEITFHLQASGHERRRWAHPAGKHLNEVISTQCHCHIRLRIGTHVATSARQVLQVHKILPGICNKHSKTIQSFLVPQTPTAQC